MLLALSGPQSHPTYQLQQNGNVHSDNSTSLKLVDFYKYLILVTLKKYKSKNKGKYNRRAVTRTFFLKELMKNGCCIN